MKQQYVRIGSSIEKVQIKTERGGGEERIKEVELEHLLFFLGKGKILDM